jgi:hypothetical protein
MSVLQLFARLGVQGRERLVHQQHAGLVGQAARDVDALLHAAGQLVRIVVFEGRQPYQGQAFEAGPESVVQAQTEITPFGHEKAFQGRRRYPRLDRS